MGVDGDINRDMEMDKDMEMDMEMDRDRDAPLHACDLRVFYSQAHRIMTLS